MGATYRYHIEVFSEIGVSTMGYYNDQTVMAGDSVLINMVNDFSTVLADLFTSFKNGTFDELPNLVYGGRALLTRPSVVVDPLVLESFYSLMGDIEDNSLLYSYCVPGLSSLFPTSAEFSEDGCIEQSEFNRYHNAMLLHPSISKLPLYTEPLEEKLGISSGVRAALYAVVGVAISSNFVLLVLLAIYRTRAIIHYSSPLFCACMLIGATVVNVAALLIIPRQTTAKCIVAVCLANLGFAMMVWSMFVKTLRLFILHRRASSMVAVSISNIQLAQGLGVGLAFEIVLILLYSFVDEPESDQIFTDLFEYHLECGSTTASLVLLGILIFYKVILVIVTWVLSLPARKLGTVFDEMSPLSVATYNLVMFTLVFVPIFLLVDDFTAEVVVLVMGLLVAANFTMYVIFIPKFVIIFRRADGHEEKELYNVRSSEALTKRSGSKIVTDTGVTR
mmetsp:Transcript_5550/g.15720  ORF Transcript_5550/g.15720 Transcript_5550/m.15720 type:complete len:448 (-) Transcript_5550:142-1485(-)